MKTAQKPPKRALSADEVEGLKREIEDKESMARATSEFGDGAFAPAIPQEVSIDKDKLREDVASLKKVLAEESPQKATGTERAKVERRMKELEDRFRHNVETLQDLGAIRMDSPEYKAALKKAKDRPKYERDIQEWKELAKRLEPDDPEFCSLDRLREPK